VVPGGKGSFNLRGVERLLSLGVYLYLVSKHLASSSRVLVTKMFKGLVVWKKCLARPM
jgi:hypothetical protein